MQGVTPGQLEKIPSQNDPQHSILDEIFNNG